MNRDVIAPRDEVLWFAGEMERQLRENDHKGGWQHMTPGQLLARVRQETDELQRAIQARKPVSAIVAEIADIANFLMMVADNATELVRDEVEAAR